MTERDQLKKIILELSYEKRLVTLASGRQSDFYFDGKQTTLHAEGGLLVGPCSGANVHAACEIAKRFPAGKVVTILCDSGERYLF